MPRVAILGDIHANLHALEAVLAHAIEQGVEGFWNLGDFVGYGAYPDQVVRRLQHLEVVSISGNYDLKVLRFPKKKQRWRKTKHPDKYYAFGWAYDQLSAESRRYLRALPVELRLEIEGRRILLTHGSPASNEEPLYLWTAPGRYEVLADMADADLVLCAHSHEPFKRAVKGVLFVNPGSVGRPGDGDPRASYAVLELGAGGLEVIHFRVAYDVGRAVSALREQALPESFAQMLLQGRSLDEVEAD